MNINGCTTDCTTIALCSSVPHAANTHFKWMWTNRRKKRKRQKIKKIIKECKGVFHAFTNQQQLPFSLIIIKRNFLNNEKESCVCKNVLMYVRASARRKKFYAFHWNYIDDVRRDSNRRWFLFSIGSESSRQLYVFHFFLRLHCFTRFVHSKICL